jgi:hypothetical protein
MKIEPVGVSMLLGPLLFSASTFYWNDGEYGVQGGLLLSLSLVFWIMVFVGLFERLKNTMPAYAGWGLLVAIYGSVSGVCFAFMGVISEAFIIPHETFLSTANKYSNAFNLLLFWPGPLFPLSILVLGVVLWRKKIIPPWTGFLMIMGGIAFPLSRIPRIEWLAHLADVLLVVPIVYMGIKSQLGFGKGMAGVGPRL